MFNKMQIAARLYLFILMIFFPLFSVQAVERITIMACPEMHSFLEKVKDIFEKYNPNYRVIISGDD
jgi:hypothetical protein